MMRHGTRKRTASQSPGISTRSHTLRDRAKVPATGSDLARQHDAGSRREGEENRIVAAYGFAVATRQVDDRNLDVAAACESHLIDRNIAQIGNVRYATGQNILAPAHSRGDAQLLGPQREPNPQTRPGLRVGGEP